MGAPIGNNYWKNRTKHGVDGMFEDSAALEKAIDDYFNNGVKKRLVEVGSAEKKTVIEIPIPTITGLCFFIGFASRQSFYDLEKKDGFAYTIKRARLFIEQEYEEQLHFGNVAGAIFALKNMGWKDKTEVDTNTKVTVNISKEDAGVL
jgi:hypothetical protein